jgi:hypothetical protein
MPKWFAFSVFALAVTSIALALWLSQSTPSSRTTDVPRPITVPLETDHNQKDKEVARLVEQLKDNENRVRYLGTIIPGGEWLEFSAPMKELIGMGSRGREMLHERLSDLETQNEVVLILGAIGDETTVPLLIEAYPQDEIGEHKRDNPKWMRTICFTFALTYLTAQPIGRSRWGADCNPCNRDLWQTWWQENRAKVTIPAVRPNASWVPHYPAN